jgi:hypothetical protein
MAHSEISTRRGAAAPPATAHAPATCEIKVLDTIAELRQSYRLRYEVYGALGYIRCNRAQLEIDEYDCSSIPFGAFDPISGAMIGTLRLVTDRPQPLHERLIRQLVDGAHDPELSLQTLGTRPHPLPSIVSHEIQRQIEACNTDRFGVLELSRTIVRLGDRGAGVSRALMELGLAYATRSGPVVLVGSCLPEHVAMYARYGYRKLPQVELVQFERVGQIANAVICRTDVLPQPTRDHVEELVRAMRAGASEITLELGRGSRPRYRFAAPRRTRRPTFELTGHYMNVEHLINVFELESCVLDATLRQHPLLRPLFSRNFGDIDASTLKQTYLRLLKLKADYVQYTVPALRAAASALRDGDDEDRRWSALLFDYAAGEGEIEHGHQRWAHDDMKALGASPDLLSAPPHASAVLYAKYFIDDVELHPYAILGAKGVLEHFSLRVSDDVVRGVVSSGIANAENATSFFGHHGALDIDHVRQGDHNLGKLAHAYKRFQVLEGAYFTSGTYRSLAHYLLPS